MNHKQLRYDMNIAALNCGITQHPQKQMMELGYNIIAAVAQSVGEQWWFTVEDYIQPLPEYLSKMEYDFDYWHGDGIMIVT